MNMQTKEKRINYGLIIILSFLTILFISPILIVLMNSFKSKLFISNEPFSFPNPETYAGGENYITGAAKIEFFDAFGYSLFITVFSVISISLVTSMLAWYITRVKTKFTNFVYY
ncbi:MAG: carbohydrate ABC transporter permease, partial [Sphaerochaeta sp.]